MNEQPAPKGDHAEEDPPRDILAVLERAHTMSVSDPTDPTRRTLYGEAAEEIRRLRAQVAAASVLGAAEPRTEYAIEILWVDHEKAGAKTPTSQYGSISEDRVEELLDSYRRDRAIAATRVLTRTAFTSEWTGPDFDPISDEEREARLDALFEQVTGVPAEVHRQQIQASRKEAGR